MSRFSIQSIVSALPETVFDWHERPGAFDRLIPPWQEMQVLERSGGIKDGARVVMKMKHGPRWVRWVAQHRDYQYGHQFCDEQVEGPFHRWMHHHRFEPHGDDQCLMTDEIDYQLPMGILGKIAGGGMVETMLNKTFAYRHRTVRSDILRHQAHPADRRLRVVISGASGLLGTQLTAFLNAGGHQVDPLVRRAPRAGSNEIGWNPSDGTIDNSKLENADVVVHLAGKNIAGDRWTDQVKEEIRRSRVDGTELLSETLAKLESPPRLFLSASAVGFYGSRGDELLDESSEPGTGFLAETCREWEQATQPAEQAGIRTIHLRIGAVVTARGGMLEKMLTPFKMGMGGKMGSGDQYMSWIAIEDLIGAIHHLMFQEDVSGAVNAVSPNPMTNEAFSSTLGKVLHRPTVMSMPSTMAKAAFGEMAEALILTGARVKPKVLQDAGFRFLYPDMDLALRHELGELPHNMQSEAVAGEPAGAR